MKNGKIVLPAGVSRTAVVEDMEYFGFDTRNIKIEVDLSSLVELGNISVSIRETSRERSIYLL